MRLDQVSAGMLLLNDVYDPNGCILVKAGVLLNDRHLKVLRSWGVAEIDAQSTDSLQSDAARDPASVAEVQEQLNAQFSLSNLDHPAVRALYAICLDRSLLQR